MTPTRLRQIAQQLVKNCAAYQEKIMQVGAYRPCRTCAQMAEELQRHAIALHAHGPLIELAAGPRGDEILAAELAALTESADPPPTGPAKV